MILHGNLSHQSLMIREELQRSHTFSVQDITVGGLPWRRVSPYCRDVMRRYGNPPPPPHNRQSTGTYHFVFVLNEHLIALNGDYGYSKGLVPMLAII